MSFGDYRALENITIPDRYPLPFLTHCNHILHGTKIYSVKARQQIPVHAADIPKTESITLFELFENRFLKFGLRNVAQTFQRDVGKIIQRGSFIWT